VSQPNGQVSLYAYRVEAKGMVALLFRSRAMVAAPLVQGLVPYQAHVTVEQMIGQLEQIPEGVRFTPFTPGQDPSAPWLFREGNAAVFPTINAVIDRLITEKDPAHD